MTRLTEIHGGSAGNPAVRWDQRSLDVLSVVQTARVLRSQFIADHLHSGSTAFGRWTGLSALFASLGRRMKRRRTLKALGQLDNRMLSDIGVSRAEIAATAALCCAEKAESTPSVWARLGAWLRRESARRRTVNELSAMSDDMLADIGIAREEIPAVAAAVAAGEPVVKHGEIAQPAVETPVELPVAPVSAQVLAFIQLRRDAQQAANENVNRPAA